MRRVLVVLALVASTTAVVLVAGARPSQAAFRVFDGLVDAGVPVPIDAGSHLRTAIQVSYTPDGSGVVHLHECGITPAPDDVAVVAAFSSQSASNVALIPPYPGSPQSCVTPTAPGRLVIDALDTFPLGNFTALPDPPQQTIAIGPGATVEVDLPAAIPDEMVATMLIRGTGTTPSFVTVWPSGFPRPLESAIGLSEGDGDVTAWPTGSGTERRISLYNQAGSASVTLQFTGWYDFELDGTGEMPLISWQLEDGAGFHQQVPTRLLDTRQTGARLAGGGVAALTFPAGQEAVALNVTLAEAGGEGFATAWPCAELRPLASNLNFVPGDEVANAVIATTDENGQVCFYASAPTDLIVDQSGWFGDGGDAYTPADPVRLLDTRVGIGASGASGPLGPHAVQLALPLGDAVPAGATSAVFNVTVTEPQSAGFAVAWPCGVPRPNASNVNYGAGETVPNLVTVPIGAGGQVCFYTSATAHLIADLQGWYAPEGEARYEPLLPTRWFDTRDEGPAPPLNTNRVQPLYAQPDPDSSRGRAQRDGDRARDRRIRHHLAVPPSGSGRRQSAPTARRAPQRLQPQLRRRPDRPQSGHRPPHQRVHRHLLLHLAVDPPARRRVRLVRRRPGDRGRGARQRPSRRRRGAAVTVGEPGRCAARRRALPLSARLSRSAGGDQLDPVAERVVAEALDATLDRIAGADLDPGRGEPIDQGVEVVDQQRRVGLTGRAEVLLDPEMDLHTGGDEPAPASCGERLGFRHAAQPQ